MVKYTRLWETMKEKKISQYRLIKYYGISAGQISRLKKNMYVSTHTIDVLCNILQCPVQDVMEVVYDIRETVTEEEPKKDVTGKSEAEKSTP